MESAKSWAYSCDGETRNDHRILLAVGYNWLGIVSSVRHMLLKQITFLNNVTKMKLKVMHPDVFDAASTSEVRTIIMMVVLKITL
jgi:hypothetical protein